MKNNRIAFLKNLQQFGEKKDDNQNRQDLPNQEKKQKDSPKLEQSVPKKPGNIILARDTTKVTDSLWILLIFLFS